MRRRLLKTLFLLILAAAGYFFFMSLKKPAAGRIGTVTDRKFDVIDEIVHGDGKKRIILWQAAFPWRYVYTEISLERTVSGPARITFPELEILKEDYYAVRAPLRVSYSIKPALFREQAMLSGGAGKLDVFVRNCARDEVAKALSPYMSPVYRKDDIVAGAETITARALESLSSRLRPMGIEVSLLEIRGPMFLPEKRVYDEGLIHAVNLRNMDKKGEMERMEVANRMKIRQEKNKLLYGHLREISRLVKDNPDLLKYIYIDKLGHDVKLILSSDSSGLPAFLDSVNREPRKAKKKNIDNLR